MLVGRIATGQEQQGTAAINRQCSEGATQNIKLNGCQVLIDADGQQRPFVKGEELIVTA